MPNSTIDKTTVNQYPIVQQSASPEVLKYAYTSRTTEETSKRKQRPSNSSIRWNTPYFCCDIFSCLCFCCLCACCCNDSDSTDDSCCLCDSGDDGCCDGSGCDCDECTC